MKSHWIILCAAAALASNAQTTSPTADTNEVPQAAAVQTNAPQTLVTNPDRPPTEIFSDSATFDLRSRIAVWIGHVRVNDPQMKLTCGTMTATVPASGKIDSIVAEQDVVIDALDNEGRPVHATGDKAVYTCRSATNETVVLTGNPQVKSPVFSGTGDTITWDRANNSVSATHPHMIIQPEVTERDAAPPRPETTGKK